MNDYDKLEKLNEVFGDNSNTDNNFSDSFNETISSDYVSSIKDNVSIEDIFEKPETESPISVKNPVPKAARYNRNITLAFIVGIAGMLSFFLFIGLFHENKPVVNDNDNTSEFFDESGTSNNTLDLTPRELEMIPDSYRKQQSLDVYGRDTIAVDSFGQQQYYGYNSQPPSQYYNNSSNIIPPPPEIEPVIVSEAVNGPSPELQELRNAVRSSIRMNSAASQSMNNSQSKQSIDPIADGINRALSLMTAANASPSITTSTSNSDPNGQEDKIKFANEKRDIKFYSNSTLLSPLSKYEIKAGTIIPVILLTGLNSDLPGNIICQVSENVYDTVTGRYLLIPQGSKVIGVYDSKVTYGQNRALVVWSRMILPNGKSLDLQSMPSVDAQGYTGLKDKVNNHYGKATMGIFLSSVMSYGAKKATEGSDSDDTFAQALAENVTSYGSKVAEKNLQIQPTIEIRPGKKFNLFVNQDFILEPYRGR
jgi:type IV secretory pathway VirB10-like protein